MKISVSYSLHEKKDSKNTRKDGDVWKTAQGTFGAKFKGRMQFWFDNLFGERVTRKRYKRIFED